jgi:hypothetical protein
LRKKKYAGLTERVWQDKVMSWSSG